MSLRDTAGQRDASSIVSFDRWTAEEPEMEGREGAHRGIHRGDTWRSLPGTNIRASRLAQEVIETFASAGFQQRTHKSIWREDVCHGERLGCLASAWLPQ